MILQKHTTQYHFPFVHQGKVDPGDNNVPVLLVVVYVFVKIQSS